MLRQGTPDTGFLTDSEVHPELKIDRVNLVICRCEDTPEVGDYTDEVIPLKPVYLAVFPLEQTRCHRIRYRFLEKVFRSHWGHHIIILMLSMGLAFW